MIETYRGMVYPNQLDNMGHMNVQWYAAKFDEATWQLFSAIGVTSEYVRDQKKGMAAVEQNTKYKSEVTSGDLLVVRSKVVEIKEKVVKLFHVMYDAETMVEVASSELVAVHLDREDRKSCPLPPIVKERCIDLFDIPS